MLNYRERNPIKLIDDFLLHFEGYADVENKIDFALDILVSTSVDSGCVFKENYQVLQMLMLCKYLARLRYKDYEIESPNLRNREN